ncbi:MAG: hypothetical protein WBJ21_06530 [Burkholderiaceae bacterium]|jgi:hypothetical protein
MSQNASHENEGQFLNGSASHAETRSIQIGLRLRAVEQSERAIVSNITAVQASSGMVFIDFGFLEQQALEEINKAVGKSGQTDTVIDGRLECRIAMGLDNVAQLHRQLEQLLNAAKKSRPAAIPLEPSTPGSDSTLQ